MICSKTFVYVLKDVLFNVVNRPQTPLEILAQIKPINLDSNIFKII